MDFGELKGMNWIKMVQDRV